MRRLFITTILLAASLAVPALAQPRGRGDRAERQEAREASREARAETREARAATREARGEVREARREARGEIREAARSGDREGAREARQALREEAAEARGEAREERREAREARGEAREARGEARGERRDARAEQRARRLATLTQRLGLEEGARPAQALDAQTRAELRTHARRVARIRRMRAVAEEGGREALVERIDALMTRENARHERRLERIAGHPLQPAAAETDAPDEATHEDDETEGEE